MLQEKEFDTDIILSMTTNKSFVEDFMRVVECYAFILKVPVPFMLPHIILEEKDRVATHIRDQYPEFVPENDNGVNEQNWREKRDILVAKLGESRVIRRIC